MNKKYFRQPDSGHYGARIYVRREFWILVQNRINPLSSWGGIDKDDGTVVAWEFRGNMERHAGAILEQCFGFTLTEDFKEIEAEV